MTPRYMMREQLKPWKEVDRDTFYRHLHNEIMVSEDYDIEKALRRNVPLCGVRHLFKIVEDTT